MYNTIQILRKSLKMGKAKARPSMIKDKIKSGSHSMNPGMSYFLQKNVRFLLLILKFECISLDRAQSDGKGGNNMRTKATIDRLKMYKNFKATRNRQGKIVKPAPFQGWNTSGTQARVEPNRKWFGWLKLVFLLDLLFKTLI